MRTSNFQIYLFALLLLLLAACGAGPLAEATNVPAETDIPISPTPTASAEPTASPTPQSEIISADNLSRLSISSSFGEGESLRRLAFSPDGQIIASAGGNSEDFSIRLWDVPSGQRLHRLEGHSGIVRDIEFSADYRFFASASSDGTVKIWDWEAEIPLRSLDFPNELVSVSFSPDSQVLAVGGVEDWPDAAIWTYSTSTWAPLSKLSEFWNIPDIAYSPDGQWLVGGGTSRNVRVWNAGNGVEEQVLFHSGQVSSIAISANGSTIATGLCEDSDDNAQCTLGAVWLWDLNTGALIKKLSDFPNWVTDVAYSPDGALLFAGSRDGALRIYDSADLQPLLLTSSPGGEGILALSPDGRLLATAGSNGIIQLWAVSP